MTSTLVLLHLVLGNVVNYSVHPDTIKALEARHLSIERTDFPAAVDYAFTQSDTDLFLAISETLFNSDLATLLADQILRLFEGRPDDEFKKSIGPAIAYSMSSVDRVARSRWGCSFFKMAVPIMFNEQPDGKRFDAEMCIRRLSMRCGFSDAPFFLKALFILPSSDFGTAGILMREYPAERLSPSVAYYIYKRFHDPHGLNFVHCITPYEAKAQPLISSHAAVPEAEIRALLNTLDKEIEDTGKKLCDKYGSVEMQPLPAPPPATPDRPGEMRVMSE